jgi:Spy/CpxP family protein refolding chaperone
MFDIRVALAATALTFGSAAIVGAQQQTAPQGVHQNHAQRPDSAHRRMGARGLRGQGQLFKGITLSDAEKANLKAVREKYASQMKAVREQSKPDMQAMRDARQRGDTAALKALWQKGAAQREQNKQVMQAERNDMRAALTPANQAKFDANVATFEKKLADGGKGGKRGIKRAPEKPLR